MAQLNDDTKMRLEQYYSYAYAGDLYVGQKVEVSVPTLMTTISGTVEAVHMVSRITPEGSKLFSAEILVDNEGALTAEMVASATVTVDGETVYPYEPGKLEYYRTTDLKSTVNGTILVNNLVDYLQVSADRFWCRSTVRAAKMRCSTFSRAWKLRRKSWKRQRRTWPTVAPWHRLTAQ